MNKFKKVQNKLEDLKDILKDKNSFDKEIEKMFLDINKEIQMIREENHETKNKIKALLENI